MTYGTVTAEPYPWPYDDVIDPARTALLLIDWQFDFCGEGGYVDKMGYDIALTRAGLAPTARLLAAARELGMTIVHTREGHRSDLADCPPNKLWRSRRSARASATPAPTGASSCAASRAGRSCRRSRPSRARRSSTSRARAPSTRPIWTCCCARAGVTHIILTGITTDVCVHTTMREANDRGYECLLLDDCTGATDLGNHEAALKMVTMQGGVFGAVVVVGSPARGARGRMKSAAGSPAREAFAQARAILTAHHPDGSRRPMVRRAGAGGGRGSGASPRTHRGRRGSRHDRGGARRHA